MAGDWKEMSLGEAIELKRGYDLPSRERRTGPFPIVSSSGISGRHAEAKAKAPGVVIGRYGTLGEVHYITEDYWPLNTALYVRDFKGNDQRFISYVLQTLDFTAYSDKAAVPGLNRNDLHTARVILPPPDEQRAIAHILGTLDDKIELNQRMSETLEAMARALFTSWFVHFDPVRAKAEGRDPGLSREIADLFPDSFEDSELGEIPEGWEVSTLADVCEKPQYGFTASASDEPIGPKFLRITDINKREWIEWEEVPFCAIDNALKWKFALKLGDVVIARIADPGHGALIEEASDAIFASYLIRFRPRRPQMARYIQYWLRSETYWSLVRSHQSGTTRANLNAQILGTFPLVVPGTELLREFEALAGACRDKVVANVRESRALATLRDTLLPKLISGELQIAQAGRFLEGT